MAPRGLHQGAKAQGRLVIEALVFQHGLAGVLHPSTRRALYELSIHMASARAGCAVIWGLCWVASRTLGTLDQR